MREQEYKLDHEGQANVVHVSGMSNVRDIGLYNSMWSLSFFPTLPQCVGDGLPAVSLSTIMLKTVFAETTEKRSHINFLLSSRKHTLRMFTRVCLFIYLF